jgi:hypothetical protein
LADEFQLGVSVVSPGGTTLVPMEVVELLELEPSFRGKEKILWTQRASEIVVTRGTPRSSYKKTKLRRGGRAAVPRHILEALQLRPAAREERIMWMLRGNEIFVRRAGPWRSRRPGVGSFPK